jgi:glutamate-1-semialdehyde 2,1-aminomutase
MKFRETRKQMDRACKVIPNGIFGHHRSLAFVGSRMEAIPMEYPHFVRRAKGCRFQDSDGNEYIDYMCGFGPMIAGYANPRIEAAAREQESRGVCFTFPSELSITLAEKLCLTQKGADWSIFLLNGSDAVMTALVIARAHTGRSLVACARDSFHGNHSWNRFGPGYIEADRSQTLFFDWPDTEELSELLRRNKVACVVLCPYEQVVGAVNRMPEPGYWTTVREVCDETSTLLLIDDIRSGFRLHPQGSCAYFGIDADLICLSKAMANGYPVAAVLGKESYRVKAEEIFVSGTFWGYAPALAAARETLEILSEGAPHEHLHAVGERLTKGLTKLARECGFKLSVSGHPAMPMVLFAKDPDFRLAIAFAQEMMRRGTYIHPTHNWFLSLEHSTSDIDRSLEHASEAFGVLRSSYSDDEDH